MEYYKKMRQYIGHERLLLIGAGVYVYREGKVLLQKRSDNGCWADHGGCLEIGETIEQTAKRELYEETGLVARALHFMGVYSGEDTFHTYPNGDQVYFVLNCWICDDFEGEPASDGDETLALAWFDLDALPENISPPCRRTLAAFVKMAKEKERTGVWPVWTGEGTRTE